MGFKIDIFSGRPSSVGGVSAGSAVGFQSGTGDPNGVVTPSKAGDEYRDTITGNKWFSKTIANDSWVEVSYTL